MQPQAYNRETDFTDRTGDDTDNSAINTELDAAALSINEIRDNLALIQKDDGALVNGIVTADALDDSAFDAVQASVNAATVAAQNSANSALTSAITANNAKDAAVVAKNSAETARDASGLNSTNAAASALAASNSAASAAASEAAALVSKNAAQSSQTAAASSAATATSKATESTTAAADALVSKNAAQSSQSSAATAAATATTKAGEASSSAAAASGSATASAASATLANTAKVDAQTAQTAAELAKANAETAETNSETAQAASEAAKVAAQLAKTNAETAQAAASSSAATASTQAGIATAQATISTTKAAEAVVSASDSAASAVSAASSAASAAALLDNFDDRYLGAKSSAPSVDNDGNALQLGALYFDSTTGKMRVYTASGWLDASSASVATLAVFNYTATAGQTSFSGADIASQTLTYTVGSLFVTLNGIDLKQGSDYTATTGSSIVLASGAVAGDELRVYAFGSFLVADTYTRAQADAGFVAKDGSGNVGIGTGTPARQLHIQNSGNAFQRIETTNTGAVAQLEFKNSNDQTHRIGIETSSGNAGFSNSTAYALCLETLGARDICFATNGAGRMKVDSSGRVTMPYQPAFIAYMSGANLSKSNITEPVPYNATQVNIGSHFNTSTYKFTAPVAGRYFFHTIINVYSLGVGSSLYCGFYKNGTQQALGTYNPSHTSSDQNIESSIMLNLAAGDYVHVYVYGAGSYGMSASGDVNANWQRFEGYLVG